MARKKINLTYISDDRLRKSAFKHRKEGLMKKLGDLKVLCGVDACLVIYNPTNSNQEVWPSNVEVNNVIEKFKMLPERTQLCNSMNHEEFLNQYIKKIEKHNKKSIRANKERDMRKLMFKCLGEKTGDFNINDNDHHDLCKFIDQYLMNLYHHKNVTLHNPHFEIGESSSMALAANMEPTTMVPNMLQTSMDVFMTPTTMAESITPINQESEQVTSLANNVFPNSNEEVYIPVINQSLNSSNHDNSDGNNCFSNNDQKNHNPVINQDMFYNLTQNQSHNQGFIEEMMNYGEQTGFPWMEESHHYN